MFEKCGDFARFRNLRKFSRAINDLDAPANLSPPLKTDAPWCGHCKALAPEYAAAATQLRNEGSNIYLAKVDATQETELSERYEVRGYPTIKFFVKGTPIEYNGGRTADQLIKWLQKKTGPAATTLTSVDEAKKFTEAAAVTVVGFFADPESAEAKAYLDAAMELDEYAFGLVTDKDVWAGLEVTQDSVVLFKNFDEKRNDLAENINKDEIKKFIAQNSLPLVVEFSHQTAQKIFGGDVKAHNLLFISKSASDSEQIIENFRSVAKDYKNKVLFVTINADVEDHERIMEFFGLKKTQVPELRIIRLEEEMTKFKPPTKDLTEDSIKSFVEGVLDGSIKQHLLSQELPEDWDKHPVKTLVSTNFDEIALDKTKDVLVEFCRCLFVMMTLIEKCLTLSLSLSYPQTPHGVDTASNWSRSTTSWARSTPRTRTS